MRRLSGKDRDEREAGMGIVEILVAMTILAIVLAALAPVLITVVRMTAHNATIAAASQIVNQRMEAARASAASCASYQAFINSPGPSTSVDGRGVSLAIQQTPAPGTTITCNASTPTQSLRVVVRVVSSGDVAAEAATVIAVPGFS